MFQRILMCIFLVSTITTLAETDMAGAQEYHTLPNGLQIIIDRDQRFPLVSMRLYIRAGAAYEQPGQEGISHFLEHMVFKGTKKRGPGQVAREIEEAGGFINAGTSFDYTVYTVDLPSDQWMLGIDILQDMIFESTFDQEELAREKNVVLAEIQRSLDNPGSRVFKSIQSMIFQNTPYEHPILGFKETVKDFDRSDLNEYVFRMYQPQSMVLAVAGDIDPARILKHAQDIFGSQANNTAQAMPGQLDIASSIDKNPENRVAVEHGPWNKAYLAMALPAPELNSPEAAAFDVLAYLLGGDSTSLFYREFKYDLGMVDQISAQVMSVERTGIMYFYSVMDPDEVEAFWKQFVERLSSLDSKDFTREQMDRAVTNIEEGVFRSRETLGGIASKLGYYQLFTKDPGAEEKYLHNLRRVARKDLQDIIDHNLHPDRFVVTSLVPEKAALPVDVFTSILADVSAEDHEPEKADPALKKDTEVIDLGMGRKLVIIHDQHLPHTSLSIAWPGGSSLILPDQQGLAQLAAGTLTRETGNRSFEQIQEFLRDRAASLNAASGRDDFRLSARFPTKYSRDILELVAEVILDPTFAEDELQRAVSDQIADIRRQEDRPMQYAFRHLFPFLFASGPYSYLHLGEEDFLREATTEMTADYWKKQRKMPFVISVCGSIDREALDHLTAALTGIETVKKDPAPEFTWSEQKAGDFTLPDRTQAHILMIFPVPGKNDPLTPTLKVLNRILAGQGGLLFRELRDRQGLAYSVTSMLWQSAETGFLALYIGTYEDRVEEAVRGFEAVISDIRSVPVPEDEVHRAANLIYGEYHRGRQTISSRAGEAASLFVQEFDLDHNLKMIEQARKVTPEELKMLAWTWLDPENSYMMRILPR